MNILITGGASGLGEAITKILAEDQKNIIYFTYNNSKVSAERIVSEFKNTRAIKCNFKDTIEVKLLAISIPQLDIDVLINNAYCGKFIKSHFHKIEPNEFLNDFTDNIMPIIEITQQAITSFRKKKSGKIITILSDVLQDTPPIGSSVYVANKAYLKMLTKVWLGENIKFNITFNSISPTFMRTKLTASFDERIIEQIIEKHPLKKLLMVGEVAEKVLFLVNNPNQMNGKDILMDAGNNIEII